MTMKKAGWLLLVMALTSVIVLMAIYPKAALESALRGLSIWWDVLFPSLFPFFVISEMLLGFGVVHLVGTLLDPLMRPLFRIPGAGGFVAAMGYVSGYPVGAKLTAKLWEQNMVNREEGERLVAFTTSSDPIFLIGAVSVGFFHDPKIGLILAIAHYGGGFVVGLLMRFHGRRKSADHSGEDTLNIAGGKPGRIKAAFQAMHAARLQDGRDLGTLVSQAIQSSLQLIIVVGGLVVFFSVFLELWTRAGVVTSFTELIKVLLSLIGMPEALSTALVGGIFEVTLGARYAGEAGSFIPLPYKAAAAAFILSWGGLSVHAQIVSILNSTNLRYFPFAVARLIHGIIAASAVILLWETVMGTSMPAWMDPSAVSTPALSGYTHIMAAFSLTIGTMIACSLLIRLIRGLHQKIRKIPR
ncbi:sporulation integral membrane protein YlbJ [Paenibacillus lactis]|uniref:Sporulation integral membrane protein YlbJ n=2 Tax=Paenibacillus lactis TaxID=228574 RepID=G4HLD3_9BACL|nr:sporulation integral membrane protein YlbJ [Paenibacillus lactis]EHB56859.1 sporulation integral membrane protein YlbJ [Paenibacillus lactis 154]MBP1892622.1 sporulation integral membrane protein YlbJ [Paenibacillus lactis]HAF97178.1 sporulation integral membrane protein YlbJ [Paenibacillus lactis]